MPNPVHYLLVGLLFGSLFLSLGVVLGVWLTKRNASTSNPDVTPDKSFMAAELQRISEVVTSFSRWTSEFNEDFSKYQAEMHELNEKASDVSFVQTRENVQKLLQQIVETNQNLRVRLDSAEKKLETQSQLLEGFLSEARTDSLTGLPNRRSFDQKIEHRFNLWTQTNSKFSLALVDIDHFKSVNDIYGHPVGDAVLRQVSQKLAQLATENTSVHVSRYGGEEFAILFDGELYAAASFAESLRQSFSNLTIPADDQVLKITLSIGVAQIEGEDRIGNLVRRSDEALYSAKLAGRNRVFVHDGNACRVFGVALLDVSGPNNQTQMADNFPANPSEKHIVQEHSLDEASGGSAPTCTTTTLEQRIRDRIEQILDTP